MLCFYHFIKTDTRFSAYFKYYVVFKDILYHHTEIYYLQNLIFFFLLSIFSYVLTGTEKGMSETFGTTCHGAVSLPVYLWLICLVVPQIVWLAASYLVSAVLISESRLC